MNKVKFLTILVSSLFILNVALLTFMFLHKPPHLRKKKQNKNFIIQTLQLDQDQILLFENLTEQHKKETRTAAHGMQNTRREIYKLLAGDINESVKDSLVKQVGDFQMNLENAHLEYFTGIKEICRKDQMDKFAKLTLELEKLFSHKGRKHKSKEEKD